MGKVERKSAHYLGTGNWDAQISDLRAGIWNLGTGNCEPATGRRRDWASWSSHYQPGPSPAGCRLRPLLTRYESGILLTRRITQTGALLALPGRALRLAGHLGISCGCN
jgi:hypothetical protein